MDSSFVSKTLLILPGSKDVGHSYDVFGVYANSKSVKKQLFDFASQIVVNAADSSWLLSTDIQMQTLANYQLKLCKGRDKDEYTKDLAASAGLSGSYSFFSASVEADFSSHTCSQTDTTYTHIIAEVEKWKLSLKDDIQSLQSKLTAEFKDDLAKLEPTDLFDRYGTHFLSEVIVGGRANFVSSTKTSSFESSQALEAAARASFFTVTAEASAKDAEAAIKFKSNSSSHLYTVGGNAGADIQNKKDYSAWVKSIDKHPMFCTFTDSSLTPIWKLAADKVRQTELERATQTFVPYSVRQVAVTRLEVKSSDSEDEQPSYGYTKIDYDLNKGAGKGSKYIYVCQEQRKIPVATWLPRDSRDQPITAVDVIDAGKSEKIPNVPSGFELIKKDLNEAAGGNYIYLCFSKDPKQAKEGLPIRCITVIGGKAAAPYGFTKIDKNLNEGVKGADRIYLCYSRHMDAV